MPSLSLDSMPNMQKSKLTRRTPGIALRSFVILSDQEDAPTGCSSKNRRLALAWRMHSSTANAKCMIASSMRALNCFSFILWKFKFCIVENIVHGGLRMSNFGAVLSTSLKAFSRIFGELKSQGFPSSSIVDRSRANSGFMFNFSAALVIRGGEYTSATLILSSFFASCRFIFSSRSIFFAIFLVHDSSKERIIC